MGRPILINDQPQEPRKSAPDFMLGWSLLLVMGWLFFLVGIFNLVVLWIPLQIGVPEFEFASVSGSLDSLPLPTMGLVFILAASRASGYAKNAAFARAAAYVIVLLVLAAAVVFWLDVPLALQATARARLARLGIWKAIIKVTAHTLLYSVALVTFARLGNKKSTA